MQWDDLFTLKPSQIDPVLADDYLRTAPHRVPFHGGNGYSDKDDLTEHFAALTNAIEGIQRHKANPENVAPVDQILAHGRVIALLHKLGFYAYHQLTVKAWAVVMTYNPEGHFRPGAKSVIASFSSEAEAQRALPLVHAGWVKGTRFDSDLWSVELTDCSLDTLRPNGWAP